jgi:hypothetical protein
MLNIINYYEQLLTDQLWRIAAEATPPLSQSALEDLACLSLNKLPACYVRSPIDKGANLSELEYQDMCVAVSKAIAESMYQVRNCPHDNREY